VHMATTGLLNYRYLVNVYRLFGSKHMINGT